MLPQLTSLSLTLTGSLQGEISELTLPADIGQCASLRRQSFAGFLHASLSLAVTDRMHQLEDLTFTHTHRVQLRWLSEPGQRVSRVAVSGLVLGLPIGWLLESFVSALADTLNSDSSIRRLSFLLVPPGSLLVQEVSASLSRLITRAPLIDQIAFEPYRYRPLNASELVGPATSECQIIQCRGARALYMWKGLQELHTTHLRDMRRIVALDPQRICMAPVSQLQSAQERMEQLQRRYAP